MKNDVDLERNRKNQQDIFFLWGGMVVMKGPAADATDTPQP
jgi:hypothetical protein